MVRRPKEHRIIPEGLARQEANTPTCEMQGKEGRKEGAVKKEGGREPTSVTKYL